MGFFVAQALACDVGCRPGYRLQTVPAKIGSLKLFFLKVLQGIGRCREMWGMCRHEHLLTRGVRLRLPNFVRELKLALRLRYRARFWVPPRTSDLRVRSGLMVSLTRFSCPARFSERVSRSVGDLSPREKWGVPCAALGNKSARLRCVCPSVAQTSVCIVGPPSLCSLTTQLPLPNLSLGGVDIRLKGLAETLLV